MSVTLKDIAEEVGVSVMTVSRALRGVSRINEDTRKRIRSVASHMGYQQVETVLFSPPTRGGKKGHTLRILLPTVHQRIGAEGGSWWLDRMVDGMNQRMSVSDGELSEQHFSDFEAMLEECSRRKYHGVVLRQPFPYKWITQLLKISAVVYGVEFDHQMGVDSVYSNEHRSAAMVLNYLTNLGHDNIVWLGIQDRYAPYQLVFDNLDTLSAADRFDYTVHGARHASWANLVYCQPEKTNQELVLLNRDWRSQSIDDVLSLFVNKITKVKKRPTAIVCSCDPIALALARHLQEAGFHVPEDFSLVSYGGSDEVKQFSVSITSVEMPMDVIGRVIPEIVERRLGNPDAIPISVQFETNLYVGKSCKQI